MSTRIARLYGATRSLPERAHLNVGPLQAQILSVIAWEVEIHGGCELSVMDLARRCHGTHGGTNTALRTLERQGLIAKTRAPFGGLYLPCWYVTAAGRRRMEVAP